MGFNIGGELTHGKSYDKRSYAAIPPPEFNKNIYVATVLDVDDDLNVGRIKVHINSVDPTTDKENLPWVYPLMPRILHIMPQVNEVVLVFFADPKKSSESQLKSNRFWIGPINTNYGNIKFDMPDFRALDPLKNPLKYTNLSDPLQTKSLNEKGDEKGIFPVDTEKSKNIVQLVGDVVNLNEVSIIGKNNTDIVQTDNKIKLRAGKHKKNKPKEPNTVNPAYSVLELVDDKLSYGLTVGDELYLISHKGRYKFKRTITSDDLNELRDRAEPMLYGNLTVKYLRTLTEVFLSHIHAHANDKPIDGPTSVNYKFKDLRDQLANIENLLAKNIKIN
jgi:hypothetical protein